MARSESASSARCFARSASLGSPAGPFWLLALSPLVIGLGYGPITAASSQLLARTTPPKRMALTFSIKQTGVPLGAAMAGIALPAIQAFVGWRGALLAAAIFGVVVALVAQTTRASLDVDLQHRTRISFANVFSPLRLIGQSPDLIVLSASGFVFAAMQMCLMSFTVVYMRQTLDATLVAAGIALTVANLGGIIGRIGWGTVADRWVAPQKMLALLGLGAGACALATASFSNDWPQLAQLGIWALFGATAIGWNGVQLAEVARRAPAGKAGAVTGAANFATFGGVVVGPPLFAALAAATGSYRTGFYAFAAASIACGCWLLTRRKPGRTR